MDRSISSDDVVQTESYVRNFLYMARIKADVRAIAIREVVMEHEDYEMHVVRRVSVLEQQQQQPASETNIGDKKFEEEEKEEGALRPRNSIIINSKLRYCSNSAQSKANADE